VPIYQRAAGFGLPGVRVDGNDVLACLAVTRAALERARRGDGPTLIEAFTYRMGAHTTSDDPTRYRAGSEVEQWAAKDPIARLRACLEANGWADQDFFDEVDRDCAEAGQQLRRQVRAMPSPTDEQIFEHVYAEDHPLVSEERAAHAAYEASFEPTGAR
jgi:pyruvate dehydrogenase E1 component alpha subunit